MHREFYEKTPRKTTRVASHVISILHRCCIYAHIFFLEIKAIKDTTVREIKIKELSSAPWLNEEVNFRE